jgi:hypothetical protein
MHKAMAYLLAQQNLSQRGIIILRVNGSPLEDQAWQIACVEFILQYVKDTVTKGDMTAAAAAAAALAAVACLCVVL